MRGFSSEKDEQIQNLKYSYNSVLTLYDIHVSSFDKWTFFKNKS